MTFYIYIFIPFPPSILATLIGVVAVFVVFFVIKFVVGFYTGS